jgi:hypothetical protein
MGAQGNPAERSAFRSGMDAAAPPRSSLLAPQNGAAGASATPTSRLFFIFPHFSPMIVLVLYASA